jgi:hypothetical protein
MQGRRTVRRFASIAIVALAIAAREQAAEAKSAVTRVHGIPAGLAACCRPPHDDDQVTVRVNFMREGAVIDEPRIVFAVEQRPGRRRRACRFHDGGDPATARRCISPLGSARRSRGWFWRFASSVAAGGLSSAPLMNSRPTCGARRRSHCVGASREGRQSDRPRPRERPPRPAERGEGPG